MGEVVERETEIAIFAGGCFWCLEPVFVGLDGVISVMPGYTGGDTPDPGYREVCGGDTGHAEAVRVVFDPARIGYRELLRAFWRNIDPTSVDRQFCDFGSQYRSAIFYLDEPQRVAAEESQRELAASKPLDRPIATEIVAAGAFFPAEEYHRRYYLKEPMNYEIYLRKSGRRSRLKELWGG